MKINSLEQVESFLRKLYPNMAKIAGRDMNVERMWPLLKKINDPQEKLAVIHVAGTSGKTSTCYFIAAQLAASDARVGLTVSPHIYSLTERLQVDGSPVEDQLFCSLFSKFVHLVGEDSDASYHEFFTAFALWAFVQLGVDYAVIETGVGGLYDSTNVCRRADKVCVITDIGLDHQNILGNTVELIADQKAGIIHENNHVFIYKQAAPIMQRIKLRVKSRHATLHVQNQETHLDDEAQPLYQQRNWYLAAAVYEYIVERDNLQYTSATLLEGAKITVPGRMQLIDGVNQTLIIDGAHNPQKMQAFVKSFKLKYPNRKVPALLAMKEGKDIKTTLQIASSIISDAICTNFSAAQDMPIVSYNPETLSKYLLDVKIASTVEPDLDTAVNLLAAKKSDLVIATGSLYLLGAVANAYRHRV